MLVSNSIILSELEKILQCLSPTTIPLVSIETKHVKASWSYEDMNTLMVTIKLSDTYWVDGGERP